MFKDLKPKIFKRGDFIPILSGHLISNEHFKAKNYFWLEFCEFEKMGAALQKAILKDDEYLSDFADGVFTWDTFL